MTTNSIAVHVNMKYLVLQYTINHPIHTPNPWHHLFDFRFGFLFFRSILFIFILHSINPHPHSSRSIWDKNVLCCIGLLFRVFSFLLILWFCISVTLRIALYVRIVDVVVVIYCFVKSKTHASKSYVLHQQMMINDNNHQEHNIVQSLISSSIQFIWILFFFRRTLCCMTMSSYLLYGHGYRHA